jgi:hypothetical protein
MSLKRRDHELYDNGRANRFSLYIKKDNVRILIRWPEDYGAHCAFIEFFDCYALQADMHFGIFPPDFILDAECVLQSQELDNIKKVWIKMGLDISGLHCYKITTNSTNSIINIFALGFRVINANEPISN